MSGMKRRGYGEHGIMEAVDAAHHGRDPRATGAPTTTQTGFDRPKTKREPVKTVTIGEAIEKGKAFIAGLRRRSENSGSTGGRGGK